MLKIKTKKVKIAYYPSKLFFSSKRIFIKKQQAEQNT